MGYGWDFGAEITSYIMNFLVQIFSSVVSAFLRLFGRKPNSPPPSDDVTAKNPSANRRLASPEPHGVFFGKSGSQYVVKSEDMDGHVLVCGGTGTGKSSCVAVPMLRNWRGTNFAIDIKSELYANTRQYLYLRPSYFMSSINKKL